jgi:hypothetical protein
MMGRALLILFVWTLCINIHEGECVTALFLEPWRILVRLPQRFPSLCRTPISKISCAALWDEVESKIRIRGYNVWYKTLRPKIEFRNSFDPDPLPILVLHG